MKKLVFKLVVLLSPLLFLMLTYVIIDPFAVVYKTSSVYEPSIDYKVTKQYLSNTKERAYNSFIFGNSKTLAFEGNCWKNFTGNSAIFDYGTPGESIKNIYHKIKLIDKLNDSLKNVLLILDEQIIRNFNNTTNYLQGPVYKHHPLTANESYVDFFFFFFKCYLSDFKFIETLKMALNGKSEVDADFLFTEKNKNFNALTCEFGMTKQEQEIEKNGFAVYYQKHQLEFGNAQASSNTLINKSSNLSLRVEDLKRLHEIKTLFVKHQTSYKVILGPVYASNAFPKVSLIELEQIFGEENVFNFSDPNSAYSDSTCFYERTHYRTKVGCDILQTVYDAELKDR